MKKVFAFLTLVIALVMVSCSSSSGPEAVVKEYYKARQAHEWGKMADLCKSSIGLNEEEKQALIGLAVAFGGSKETIDSFTVGEVTMVDDTHAEVAVEIVLDKKGEKDTDKKTIDVEKIDGKWYIED